MAPFICLVSGRMFVSEVLKWMLHLCFSGFFSFRRLVWVEGSKEQQGRESPNEHVSAYITLSIVL